MISKEVSDGEAMEACVRFANGHRMLVEPACGSVLASVYSGHLTRQSVKRILLECFRMKKLTKQDLLDNNNRLIDDYRWNKILFKLTDFHMLYTQFGNK